MVAAGSKRLVFVGSLAATGPSVGGVPRVEEDSFAPQEWYGESKVEAEKIAFSYAGKLEVTCCRPARIIGPGDHENLTFFKLVKKGVVLKIGGPERKLSFVDVEDVVDQLLLQADKPEAIGESFFSASDEFESVEELMRIVGQVLGLHPRTVYVPELVLSALGSAADMISNVSGKKLPLNRKLGGPARSTRRSECSATRPSAPSQTRSSGAPRVTSSSAGCSAQSRVKCA
jgi:nucleoside-diphosphate-sugar epimerase